MFANTPYHYRVRSRDAEWQRAQHFSDATFTTMPPVISAALASPAMQGATITWTTGTEASTYQVGYGFTMVYGSTTALAPALVTSHTVTLSGLTSNTLYHYRARPVSRCEWERTASPPTSPSPPPPTACRP